jgi:hypothetical protein
LKAALTEHLVADEERAREGGWGYLANLSKELGPWPPRKERPPSMRKAGKRPRSKTNFK